MPHLQIPWVYHATNIYIFPSNFFSKSLPNSYISLVYIILNRVNKLPIHVRISGLQYYTLLILPTPTLIIWLPVPPPPKKNPKIIFRFFSITIITEAPGIYQFNIDYFKICKSITEQ